MIDWIKRNPNRIMGLIWPGFLWGKAVLEVRFGYKILPETETFMLAVLTAFGLGAVANKGKK